MGPKSALYTTGDPPKPKVKLNPLTTAGKIAKAEAKKNKPELVTRSPPKNPKPRTIPPPGEAFQTRPKAAAKKSTKPKKAIITQEKIKVAELAKKAKGGIQPKEKKSNAGKGKAVNEKPIKAKPSNLKPPGMLSVIKSHDATTNFCNYSEMKKQKEPDRPSVLVRPSAKALVWKAQHPTPMKTGESTGAADEVFNIMGVPKEVRIEIWELVVVDTKCFVWANSKTGREQPDLAKVSREIREEVLPIFYTRNTFAVDIVCDEVGTDHQRVRGNKEEPSKSLSAVRKWAKVLEAGDWFGMIRKWAFSCAPVYTEVRRLGSSKRFEGQTFILSVRVKKKEFENWGAVVEIHRDALCMLSGNADYGHCKLETVPIETTEAVYEMLGAAKGKGINGDMVADLGEKFREQAWQVSLERCTDARAKTPDFGEGPIMYRKIYVGPTKA